MTYEEFEEYSFETPNLFYFIDKLCESLHTEVANMRQGYTKRLSMPNQFESYSANDV